MGFSQAAGAATGTFALDSKRRKLCLQSLWSGPFRAPQCAARPIIERLGTIVRFSVAANALKLIVFALRYHAAPSVLGREFPLDRRALALDTDLDLSEKNIRTAIGCLVEHGLIERVDVGGSAYRRSENGVRRKAILYRFTGWLRVIIEKLHGRLGKRPKDRDLDYSSLEKEAPEKLPLSMGRFVPKALPPSRPVDLATIPDEGLRGVLSRMLTGIRRKASELVITPPQANTDKPSRIDVKI